MRPTILAHVYRAWNDLDGFAVDDRLAHASRRGIDRNRGGEKVGLGASTLGPRR